MTPPEPAAGGLDGAGVPAGADPRGDGGGGSGEGGGSDDGGDAGCSNARGSGDDIAVEPIEHTADAGFIVTAPSLPRLLTACAQQMMRLAWPEGEIRPVVTRTVETAGHDLVELLVNWLAEINALGALRREVYGRFAVDELSVAPAACRLRGRAEGEPIDPARHAAGREIKAVTFHQAEAGATGGGRWRARVIFDL